MTRSATFILSAVVATMLNPLVVRAQSFGRDAEASRLSQTGNALLREEERLWKSKAWLKEQYDDLERRKANYQRCKAVFEQMVTKWRCPNGYTLRGCFDRPPACNEARDFQSRAMTAAEMLERENRAINVQSQRIDMLTRSLASQFTDYYQRLNRYKGDRRDFDRRYPDDGQLIFDDSVPKAQPR